jgi:hypothetical protein
MKYLRWWWICFICTTYQVWMSLMIIRMLSEILWFSPVAPCEHSRVYHCRYVLKLPVRHLRAFKQRATSVFPVSYMPISVCSYLPSLHPSYEVLSEMLCREKQKYLRSNYGHASLDLCSIWSHCCPNVFTTNVPRMRMSKSFNFETNASCIPREVHKTLRITHWHAKFLR